MMMRRVFAMTVLVLGFGVTAHADILSAGPMFGSPNQFAALCYLFNAGTGPVTVETREIFREGVNTPQILSLDTCPIAPATLPPNESCVILLNNIIGIAAAHTCKFVLSPSAEDVRGGFELRTAVGEVLTRADLR